MNAVGEARAAHRQGGAADDRHCGTQREFQIEKKRK